MQSGVAMFSNTPHPPDVLVVPPRIPKSVQNQRAGMPVIARPRIGAVHVMRPFVGIDHLEIDQVARNDPNSSLIPLPPSICRARHAMSTPVPAGVAPERST